MDALFGLSCKKSAGSSYKQPLNRNQYFLPQNHDVDEFVHWYKGEPHNDVCTGLHSYLVIIILYFVGM